MQAIRHLMRLSDPFKSPCIDVTYEQIKILIGLVKDHDKEAAMERDFNALMATIELKRGVSGDGDVVEDVHEDTQKLGATME